MKDKLLFTKSLEFWLERKNLTQKELAERLGTTPNTISQYKTGTRTPPMETMEELVAALDLSVPEFFACQDGSLPDIEFVPRVKARPRAGTGGLEVDGGLMGHYAFHSSFLLRKGGSTETMRIFEVDGDSMEPTLSSGDLIMINQKYADISSGHVYLIRFEGELMVKRLERRPKGVILIKSDNEAYEPIEYNPGEDESTDFHIFGRMVWSCREY